MAFLSNRLEPKQITISEAENTRLGDFIRITGEVTKVNKAKITSFNIKDQSGEILVVSFEKTNISKGDELEILGKVDEYYGTKEIIAERISKI